ncbi:MAG: hypothetical protein ACREBV_07060 [Candidatus Zixiibacteriota bacterium]
MSIVVKQGIIFGLNITFFLLVSLVVQLGCGQNQAELVVDIVNVKYADSTLEFPRIVFADGQVSMNGRCMVRMAKLNRKMPPIYVNGRPVGFC